MKRLIIINLLLLVSFAFISCEKDNLEGPDASFYGQLIDKKTGEPIAQEIIEGSRLYYIETGWNNPPVQNMAIKSDGSFRNNMMFSGKYLFILNRGNYVPLDTMEIEIKKGNNRQLFELTPYLRVLEPEIVKNGRSIIATFRLDQVSSFKVSRISLFAHSHIDVSNGVNILRRDIMINGSVNDTDLFSITIDLDENASILKEGTSYYFRIGAQAQGNEAKYNYAEPILIKI